MGWTDILEGTAAALRSAGIFADVDPRNINPPGVLVRGDAIVPGAGKLCGILTLRYSLLLVVPDIGELGAYAALEDLFGALPVEVTTLLDTEDRRFERLIMPDFPTALPCLHLSAAAMLPAPVMSR